MAAVGGSIESISLKGRNFAVSADSDTQRKIGGYENATEANGDGTGRLIKTRVNPGLSGLTVEVDDSRGDHGFLQDLADLKDYWPVAIVYASGEVWQGRMQIEGEMQYGNQSATASFDLKGVGTLERQS